MRLILFISILFALASCGRNSSAEDRQVDKPDSVNFQTIVISVGGMTCGGCETTIESAVSEIEGVKSVNADYTDSIAIIRFDTTLANFAQISETINQTGYVVLGEKTGK